MTWPPAELPIDFENATPQENTHPDAHNTTNQTINADLVPEINRVGALADTIGLYLPLTGGTVTGDLQVDGQTKAANSTSGKPSYAFTADPSSGIYGNDVYVAMMQGGEFNVIAWDGRTEVRGKLEAKNDLQVDGVLYGSRGSQGQPSVCVGGAASKSGMYGADTGVAFAVNGAYKLNLTPDLAVFTTDVKISGQTQAQNGTKTAPAYSFTSDPDTGIYLYSAGVTSIACAGKNVANFGVAGVSFPEGLAEITGTAANMHIGPDGQIRRITDVAKAPTTADVSRLETVIETLTARIEELEARLKPAATDV